MTIQQLATATGLSKHTLRYYERIGLVPRVARDQSSGHRRYLDDHVIWIEFLRDLRSTGMPIRDVCKYARLIERGDASWPSRKALLAEHRARVLASIRTLQQHRAMLDRKLALGCAPGSAPALPAARASGPRRRSAALRR